MDEPTNAELSQQIETVAQAVANVLEHMATKEETNKRFDGIEQRLHRIENEHVRRLENLELSAVDLRRDITKLKTHAGIE